MYTFTYMYVHINAINYLSIYIYIYIQIQKPYVINIKYIKSYRTSIYECCHSSILHIVWFRWRRVVDRLSRYYMTLFVAIDI